MSSPPPATCCMSRPMYQTDVWNSRHCYAAGVDLASPHHDLGTGATGDVLLALHDAERAMSGRRVAERSGRSTAQVAVVLRDLVAAGLVTEQPVPPAILYEINEEHVLFPVVEAMSSARTLWLDRLRALVAGWTLPPIALAAFGSSVTGQAASDSDIDVLVVRAPELADDDAWQLQLLELTVQLFRWTGSDVDLVEVSPAELRRNRRLLREVAAHGVVLAGSLPTPATA